MVRGRYLTKADYQWSTSQWIWIRSRTNVLRLQLYCHEFYGQGMWRRAIQWCVQEDKGSSNSSGSHRIRKPWDRGDHNPNTQRSDLDGRNHISHPVEPQPITFIWDDIPRQLFYIIPNFYSNGVPWLYDPIVFQRYYTWSHHNVVLIPPTTSNQLSIGVLVTTQNTKENRSITRTCNNIGGRASENEDYVICNHNLINVLSTNDNDTTPSASLECITTTLVKNI